MSDIWNPWHGCKKISEGCKNCYMYSLDAVRGQDGSNIYKVKNNFSLPLKKDRDGKYKIKSGERIRVCITSDFFLEEADAWRNDAWEMMRKRSDVFFFLLTKRVDRVSKCLPKNYKEGFPNIQMNVTIENQKRADERLPILLDLPFSHKGLMAAPLLSEIHIEKFLASNQIESVIVGGENYEGARPCSYDWVKCLYDQCAKYNVNMNFYDTGSIFIKDGKTYNMPSKLKQMQATKSKLNYYGRNVIYQLDKIDDEYEQISLLDRQ